ncbi:CLUMA_CG007262, isoform A [Clunio marinus]|uniref:CLUMA_CG007262, isoform A n=1 Tax=Clunio marinus TaxID=568069 RepID=A0A1J1I4D7_9DIPT|nr:CLUMA_CG007262, isoform A [Clunio marinus]
MVFLQNILFKEARKKIRKYKPFLDSLRITVEGGHGGNGMPKYGGIGGQGGAVVFKASEQMTLKRLWKLYPSMKIKGGNGEDSNKNRLIGRRGTDSIIEVPTGLTLIDETQNKIIGEIDKEKSTCLVAGGGSGGCSGSQFIGRKGQHRNLRLDLKLIADVGLVGFPNAGKSTLLKALSKARPKIASYPFTTILPQIGTIEYQDYRQITIADLPGLIEGAHRNIGMGHQFLKHVERTKLLLVIIDIFGFQLSQKYMKRNCLENIYSLNKELELYDPTLLDKPAILLINKMDMNGSDEEHLRYEKHFSDLSFGLKDCPTDLRPEKLIKFERILPISAKEETKVDTVKEAIREVLENEYEKRFEDGEIDALDKRLEVKLREHGPKMV